MNRIIFLLCCAPLWTNAQFTYVLDQSIPVEDENSNRFALAWAGGLNAAQYNTMDLNGDSQPDLVLFDRMANKVITFLNKNNQYQYAPEYESLFPELSNWLLLRDFNCDGKKDIFTGDVLGIRVYRNVTLPGGQLAWDHFLFFTQSGNPKSPVLLTKGFSGKINLQLQFDDLPSISDVDGDGDLDIFNMRFAGAGTIEFHKNFSMERYSTCDSLEFERVSQAWGGVTECECGVFAFNNEECPSGTGGRTKHSGGKALLAIDMDNDADQDILFSEAECTRIYYLENEGDPATPVLSNATLFPASRPANLLIFPAPFYEDVDFDGINDIVVAPNIFAKEFLNTDLRHSNWFYKNTGSTQIPSFTFLKNNFLQEQMIDVGDNSVPAFADYDGDGDPDLFIGHSNAENVTGSIFLFENTGTKGSPSFRLVTEDYHALTVLSLYNIKPQFTDLNSDGRIDLLFTATGLQTGQTEIYYLINNSASGISFTGTPQLLEGPGISFTENIHAADVNLDGLADLLIGRNTGAVEYWKNSGPRGAVNLVRENDTFLNMGQSILRQSPALATGDLNADGKADLVIGDQKGMPLIVSNYREATDISGGIEQILFDSLANAYTARSLGGRIWPAIANLYNTDKPALVCGNLLGGLQVLKNDDGKSLPDGIVIEIYPNPLEREEQLMIKADRPAVVQLVSLVGQELTQPVIIQANQVYPVHFQRFSPGLYLVRVVAGNKSYSRRLVVY